MVQTDEVVIGIDLGTTFSCAAVVRNGKARIIPSGKGYMTVPSVVGISKRGEILVGHVAMDQIVMNPAETIYGSKRLIGRKFNSMVVQKMLQAMTYKIVEGPKAEAAVMLNGKIYTLTDVASFILSEVKDMAQGQLGFEIKRAVITVPAYYSDNQRQAVIEAGKKAGLQVDRIVNEPTAAAIAYGFNKGFEQRILVYDLGGGTFDISILEVKGNVFKVLATGGDTFLGGVDFDTRITDYVADKFKEATGKDIRTEKVALQRLRGAAERAKRDLSIEKIAPIELPYLTEVKNEPVDLKIKLTRQQLEKLTTDLIERTIKICEEVLGSAKFTAKDIDEILLVGGQTRMPLVAARIEQFFGKPPKKGVHPDEVVALGAAILGDAVASKTAVKLEDVLSIPIGLALPNGQFKIILGKNTALPTSKVYKMTLDRTKTIDIDIYQGEMAQVLENEYLGTFSFPPPAKGKKGTQRLELKFELSPQCLLSVRATDLESGKQTSAQMVTHQTPKSLYEGIQAALNDKAPVSRLDWFKNFAKRVLGKST